MAQKQSIFQKLKTKWGINSNLQVVLILIAFAFAGSSIVVFRPPIFTLLQIDGETNTWLKVIIYLIVMFPIYQVLLLFYGTILGQFNFFWSKQKLMMNRMVGRKKTV